MTLQNRTKIHSTPLIIHGYTDAQKTGVLASVVLDGSVQDYRVQVAVDSLADPLPDDLPVLKALVSAAASASPVPQVPLPFTPTPAEAGIRHVDIVAASTPAPDIREQGPKANVEARATDGVCELTTLLKAASLSDSGETSTTEERAAVEAVHTTPGELLPPAAPASTALPPSEPPVAPVREDTAIAAVSQPNPNNMSKKSKLPDTLGRGRPHEVYYVLLLRPARQENTGAGKRDRRVEARSRTRRRRRQGQRPGHQRVDHRHGLFHAARR
jgi:hypothetical protein